MPQGVVALAGHIGNEDFPLAFVNQVGGPIHVENGSSQCASTDGGLAAALAPGGAAA